MRCAVSATWSGSRGYLLQHALEQVETKLQNDPGFAQTIKDITININSKK